MTTLAIRRVPLVALLSALLLVVLAPSSASAFPAGSTVLVSRPDGADTVPPALDGDSSTPGALSADGRYAVFSSEADGLTPGADPRVRNLFLRDRQTGTTFLVSRSDGPDGTGVNAAAANPDLVVTAGGHVLVVFESAATNLTDHETGAVDNPRRVSQVWLRDVTDGTTTLVSRADGVSGAAADESSRNPAIADSAGGPLVVFDTQATNIGATGVLLRTVNAHTTAQVSCPSSDCEHPGNSPSSDPDITVVPAANSLCSTAQNPLKLPCVQVAFVSADRTIFNTQTPQVIAAAAVAPIALTLHPGPFHCCNALSISGSSFGNAGASAPSFSGDGQAVAFLTFATNLGGTVTAGTQEAYVRGIHAPTLLLSKTSADEAANDHVSSVALGGTVTNFSTLAGLRAVFATSATNLGGKGSQSYVNDIGAKTTSLLNRAAGANGEAGNAPAPAPPAISADAGTALFATPSSNIGDGQVGQFRAVHARALAGLQDVDLVSRPTGNDPLTASGSDDSSFRASRSVVSANGRYVAFDSQSDSLSPVDDDRFYNVFVRDLQTRRTVLVSRATGARGVAPTADSEVAGISADGRKVAFTSAGRDLDPEANGEDQAYVRDLDADTTTLVSRPDGAGAPPAAGAAAEGISANGNAVVMTSLAALDPAGGDGQMHVYVRDLSARTTTLADRDDGVDGAVPNLPSQDPVINADGTRVAWVTTATIAGVPPQPKLYVYLRDLRSHETKLVSRANGLDGAPGDGASTQPAINAAGDVVAFISESQNLGAPAGQRQIFVRDMAAGRTELVSRAVDGGTQLPEFVSSPSIDASGNRVAFLGFGAIDTPPTTVFEAYVRDRRDQTTTLVSRADGPSGAAGDGATSATSISASGDCVAFAGRFANMGDGFASADFRSVHLRAVRNECPGAEGTGHGPGTTPPTPPVLSGLAVSPKRFHVGGRKSGTTIRFKLSAKAKVTVRIDRVARGHRKGKGKACVAKGHGKPCTILRKAGTLTVAGRKGANHRRFSGKLKGKSLRPGRYRLTATPATGKARTRTFTVVAAPKAKPAHRRGP